MSINPRGGGGQNLFDVVMPIFSRPIFTHKAPGQTVNFPTGFVKRDTSKYEQIKSDSNETHLPTKMIGVSGQKCLISGIQISLMLSKDSWLSTEKHVRNTSV